MSVAHRVALVMVVAACLARASVDGRQTPAQPPAQPPVFRASTELVVVDVVVLDGRGVPVRDLGREEFSVRLDGQPRRVASMQFIDHSVEPPPRQAGGAPPRVSANDSGVGGRLVMLVIDERSIRFGGVRPTMESVGRLLAGFGRADRFALAVLPGPRMLVDFTDDRARLTEAVKRVTGAAEPARGIGRVRMSVQEAFALGRADSQLFQDVFQRECAGITDPKAQQVCQLEVQDTGQNIRMAARNQSIEFVNSMRTLLESLQPIDTPKIVVVFSEGMPSPEAPHEISSLAIPAAAARATIHAVRLDRTAFDTVAQDPAPFSEADRLAAHGSLDVLAGVARGSVVDVVTSGELPLSRLATAVSGYYLLGVEADRTARDGRPHRIEVGTSRPGLSVQARSEFVFSQVVDDDAALLVQTLRSPLQAVDIPVRVTTANTVDEDPGKVRVLVVARVGRGEARSVPALVGLGCYDDKGRSVGGYTRRTMLEKTDDTGTLSFHVPVIVPPGTYRLKFAVVREGRAGSLEHRLVARLSAGASVKVGDLVVIDPPPSGGRAEPSVEPRLAGNRIWSFVPFAVDEAQQPSPAFALEIAKRADGPTLVSGRLYADASSQRTRVASGEVDGRLLPPGDYVARLRVTAGSKTVATIATPFAFERANRHGRPQSAATSGPDGRPGRAVPFTREELLQASVVGPFLDELDAVVSDANRPALQTARSGRFDEALRQARTGEPGDPVTPFLRGLALLAGGQTEAAIEAFRQSVQASPDVLVGSFYAGACHSLAGREIQAITTWETSLGGLNRFPVVYRFLVDALVWDGQTERAAQILDEALWRWPDDSRLRGRIEAVLIEAGRYERVLEYADAVLEKQPDDGHLLFLALEATFLTAADQKDVDRAAVTARFERYRVRHAAAKGPNEALVQEWATYLQR